MISSGKNCQIGKWFGALDCLCFIERHFASEGAMLIGYWLSNTFVTFHFTCLYRKIFRSSRDEAMQTNEVIEVPEIVTAFPQLS